MTSAYSVARNEYRKKVLKHQRVTVTHFHRNTSAPCRFSVLSYTKSGTRWHAASENMSLHDSFGMWTHKGGVGKTTMTFHLSSMYAGMFSGNNTDRALPLSTATRH